MTLITLDQWNAALFGGRYSRNTLRTWAKNGHIQPPARKVGRDWLVEQCARFHKPQKPFTVPEGVDTTLDITDPTVLAILNQK